MLGCWQKFLSSDSCSWAHKFKREGVNSEPQQGPLISLNNTVSVFLFAGLFFVGLVPELLSCMATKLSKSNAGNGILAEKNRNGDLQCPFKQPVSVACSVHSQPHRNPIIYCHPSVGCVTVPDLTTLQYPATWACNMPYLESLGFP